MTTIANSARPRSGAPGRVSPRKIWPWICLAAILAAFAFTIAAIRPASNFGGLQDDSMYFASAKALASGQGYRLPSFPGGLATLKYPELYPWLLSWVWRLDPSFPGNVVPAIGLSVVFACWFLVACFLLAKRTFGLEPAWALVVVALCAFNFFTLLLGGSVLSDLPFAALALSAALAADRSLEPGGHWAWMVLAGVLAGLSVGLRTVGVTVLAGIVLLTLLRRVWRKAALFCIVSGGLCLPWILPAFLRAFGRHYPATSSPLPLGWTQTLAFYNSYIGQWRHFVPNWATQRAVLLKNSFSTLLEPGIFLLFPLAASSALLSVGLGGVVTIASWSGIALRIRRAGRKSIDAVFLFYLAMVLPWPFPPQRFLVPFLPLFFGGLVFLSRELVRYSTTVIQRSAPPAKPGAATALRVALLAVACIAVENCAYSVPKRLASLAASQRIQRAKMQQAYRWIAWNTAPDARFIAYDDVLLYLYTNRQAVRPIAATPAADYDNDPAYARLDAAHLGDVARHVEANYWLVSPADFDRELGDDQKILTAAENILLSHFPIVFQSGSIRIYTLPPEPGPPRAAVIPRSAATRNPFGPPVQSSFRGAQRRGISPVRRAPPSFREAQRRGISPVCRRRRHSEERSNEESLRPAGAVVIPRSAATRNLSGLLAVSGPKRG